MRICFMMNNSFAKISPLLSSIFSGCLRTNRVILAVIHYSLNIFCERCSLCSSSSGSHLGSVQNQSCLPKAPHVCWMKSRLQTRSSAPPRRPKSSGLFYLSATSNAGWSPLAGLHLLACLRLWPGFSPMCSNSFPAAPHHWPATHASSPPFSFFV